MPHTINRLEAEDAQTMAEYAVVLGVITLAIVTTIAALSASVNTLFERVVGLFS